MTVFWDVASCSLADVSEVLTAYIIRAMSDGRSEHLWNVGQFLPDYTAHNPRRLSSSHSPPWEAEISSIWNKLCENTIELLGDQPSQYGTILRRFGDCFYLHSWSACSLNQLGSVRQCPKVVILLRIDGADFPGKFHLFIFISEYPIESY
jgi:hypothetical protein